MDIQRFLAELKGRGVYRVAAIYAAGSWALLQVADMFFPILGFPDWAITMVLAAAAIGFPLAIALSWIFDLTPQGIVETNTVNTNFGRMRLSPARLLELGLILALVFLVGFLYLDRLKPDRQQAPEDLFERESIAVMPFVNMSDMSEVEYFGDGLAEEILNLLARLNELDVAARTSSFYFKNRDVDIKQIAEHLGVRHVLEGSVRRQGDTVRVTAQLIDASNGFHLWSETYDRDFKDTFRIQDEIARQVVNSLQVILSDNSQQILDQRPVLDPQAYDYYLRGREYLRESLSADNLDRAEELFTKAVELDPEYAEAYAGLCDSYLEHYRIELDPLLYQHAETACQQALDLDSRDQWVYIARGNLYRYSGKYGEAINEFGQALAINPNAVDALIGLAETYQLDNKPQLAHETFLKAIQQQPNYWRGYMSMGRFLFATGSFSEAIPYYRRIASLMPDNAEIFNDLGAAYFMLNDFESAAEYLQMSLERAPTALAYSNAGASLFFLGRFEEAAEMYQKAVEYAPEDFQNWGALGDAYRYTRDFKELAKPMYINAIKLASERLKINPMDALTLGLVAHYQASIGDREQALQYIARANVLGPGNLYVHYNTATTMCALGELDQARDALGKAIELGYSSELVKIDASLCGLGDHPPFNVAP